MISSMLEPASRFSKTVAIEQFHVTREQIQAVLEFAARSLDAPPIPTGAAALTDAHSR